MRAVRSWEVAGAAKLALSRARELIGQGHGPLGELSDSYIVEPAHRGADAVVKGCCPVGWYLSGTVQSTEHRAGGGSDAVSVEAAFDGKAHSSAEVAFAPEQGGNDHRGIVYDMYPGVMPELRLYAVHGLVPAPFPTVPLENLGDGVAESAAFWDVVEGLHQGVLGARRGKAGGN